MGKPLKDWITPAQFHKLDKNIQNEYVSKLKELYIDKLESDDYISDALNLSNKLIMKLKNENNIHRTKEQTVEYIKKQNINKYGVEWKCQTKEVKEKLSNAWKHKSEKDKQAIIDKRAKTNLEKYGNRCSLHGSNQEKIKQIFMDKYGVTNPWQQRYIREKIKETYGAENPFNSEICQQKVIQTKLERYGDPYYNNKEKTKITNLKRYGVTCVYQLEKFRIKSGATSKINMRFAELLKENNIEFKQEFNIKNRSYDFKVDNILIEINPTYTHNSTIGAWFGNHQDIPLSNTYHLEKSNLAKSFNFHCIHVWEWDDWNKIINLLSPKQKLYARKCEIREVDKKETNNFLNKYHLQNTCNGQKVRLGLYYNNELVQIMTFGKPRYNKNYEWELLRLCSHKDYQIIGGSQRLWSHFIRQVNPSNMISYCDNSKFSGRVYKTLGMELKYITKPSVQWSKRDLHITNSLLNQRGYDQLFGTSYGKGTSNRDLMIENGWKEVYDCGQQVYTWTK